ncbi:FAD-dependent 5-carboxymethylaminomethyl-2-thiouridine(34) oxidoreductase MnmC [Leptospira sp. 2 VSF19]|uniref:FAD-dependent 5-carboxymethylaminomethyl-2-thiouridine(34) oxidoreductase MnmC n=1 Tax=Leptospira soteropolitanensis TaxID=2950025 RepID=A0AAW5VRB5_9LEPT|nr:FAD-dependent 5-carboxymethylaminomethyl-2-thiouridine(34) oxidoreductase MnmC [Leptospira soteropolitanensis]MCW7493939.1 FAD-dependent 5-carboxymethylaminomethyl-2-thiouridine(34) oxidoreductase MnmC [Leptospira soteropolitanensis]MCW7501533.1 FAD-dependent 5-carboxymethylaminomethyl-2-thiouridine(34) oxidoreductase MnmC [Leptospira soteropolitanensis]MCW7523705.1 FAD-dependent 5-carboxymethylaminomethyl-2-thiouridine(34) oxidoreductase MnmC [Leptospira soteropolitanensis]MCW7527568.1 FAD-
MQNKTAVVVGAGIAGASISLALKQRNIETILIEADTGPAKHASGNPIGVVYPFLTKHKLAESEFSLASFLYFLSIWEKFRLKNLVPHVDGIYFLLDSKNTYDRYTNALISHQIPISLAKESIEPFSNLPSIFFPEGKSLSPVCLTNQLLILSEPTIKYSTKLLDWEESENGTKVICQTDGGKIECDYLCLTQGYQFADDPNLAWLPLKKVRGQIIKFPEQNPTNSQGILYGDYITPAINGYQVLGATFDEFKLDENPRPEETENLWKELSKKLPNLVSQWDPQDPQSFSPRVSYRTQSQDRHPVVGKLPNLSKLDLSITYQNSLKNSQKKINIPYYESVGILNGLGSRGLTHALYAAEILVSTMLKEPNSIPEPIFNSLKPDRFLIRMWKREQLT